METSVAVAIIAAVATIAAALITTIKAHDSRERMLKSIEVYTRWNEACAGREQRMDAECLEKLAFDIDWQIEKTTDPRWSHITQMIAAYAVIFLAAIPVIFFAMPNVDILADSYVFRPLALLSAVLIGYLVFLYFFVRLFAKRRFLKRYSRTSNENENFAS